jgi:hypothetical protein
VRSSGSATSAAKRSNSPLAVVLQAHFIGVSSFLTPPSPV